MITRLGRKARTLNLALRKIRNHPDEKYDVERARFIQAISVKRLQ
jgi:hypothetical protein